ncbi:MAG: OmpA family protein [Draconibacterium sp.]|nr:OmpA family protein [Draconibacterium sp.]
MKNILAIILTLAMILSLAPMANAGSGTATSTATIVANPVAESGTGRANSDANAGATAFVGEAGGIKNSFNGGPGKRGLPILNQATFLPPASFFGPNEEGHQFMPLETLLHFVPVWSVEQAKNAVYNKQFGKDVEIRPLVKVNSKTTRYNEITCMITEPAEYTVLGFGAIAATDDESITPDVLAKAILEAHKIGANTIQFLGQGKNVKLLASGWGININGGVTVIGGDNKDGDAGGGGGFAGTGFSKYESGYANMPWLQMVFLNVTKMESEVPPQPVRLDQAIMFDHDSYDIRGDQEPILDKIAAFMAKYPDTAIVIEGYASEEGATDYNLVLSDKRAESVNGALVDKGVDPTKITSVEGKGETTMFGELLKENRRVIVLSVD